MRCNLFSNPFDIFSQENCANSIQSNGKRKQINSHIVASSVVFFERPWKNKNQVYSLQTKYIKMMLIWIQFRVFNLPENSEKETNYQTTKRARTDARNVVGARCSLSNMCRRQGDNLKIKICSFQLSRPLQTEERSKWVENLQGSSWCLFNRHLCVS